MDWPNFIKRYAWDEKRTPYLIRVPNLSKFQAKKEVFVYALFVGILFALITLTMMAGAKSGVNYKSLGIAFYAFSVFCGAVILGWHIHPSAALYVVGAPVAVFFYLLGDGMGLRLGSLDKVMLMLASMLWLRYSLRVLAIAKAYADMPEEPEQG
ncbi:MAG: hypothetical protein O6934_08265 [SAR324 cluster bacterium]|nr:hypothetical protein [SAR324 cluster bacterium]